MADDCGVGTHLVCALSGFFFALVLLNPSYSEPFAGRPYKFEKTGSILYYDPANIPEADAKFVGNELEEMGYFSKDTRLPAAFRKEGDKYTIELLVDNNHWDSVNDDVSQFLRVFRQWHRDSEFQVRFLGTDSTGRRKTKILSQ